jgi:mevalonate pyrophosphate decarboxylase
VGGYAQWHAGWDDESSYAERIAGRKDLDLGIVIVPLSSEVRTEEAHREVETSPFFNARVKSASKRCSEMRDAILKGDLIRVAQLAEIDSLELHALTMTGEKGLVAYKPESILLMSEIRKMRQNGLNAYFSMQTGPSVFINTYPEEVNEIKAWVEELGLRAIESGVGEEVKLV